jgi:hypothetical protein
MAITKEEALAELANAEKLLQEARERNATMWEIENRREGVNQAQRKVDSFLLADQTELQLDLETGKHLGQKQPSLLTPFEFACAVDQVIDYDHFDFDGGEPHLYAALVTMLAGFYQGGGTIDFREPDQRTSTLPKSMQNRWREQLSYLKQIGQDVSPTSAYAQTVILLRSKLLQLGPDNMQAFTHFIEEACESLQRLGKEVVNIGIEGKRVE